MINNNNYWSVNEFAKYANTTRHTLMHYDKIGLISPVSRGHGNHYRYYHSTQLTHINLIRSLHRLGMTLNEIKDMKDTRTPQDADAILKRQITKIDAKINEWVSARKLLLTIQKTINSALSVDEEAISIQYLPAEAIILGGLNDYSRGRNDYDALSSFYHEMIKQYPGLDISYPVWGRYSERRIKGGDWKWPDRYYFYNPEGYDQRPAALYAVGYTRCGYSQGKELYKRLTKYIDEHDYEICGDAYEEYPLNEVSIADDNNYLMRVLITVKEKAPEERRRRAYNRRKTG